MVRPSLSAVVSFAAVAALLLTSAVAGAAFPGRNGVIAYSACSTPPTGPSCGGPQRLMRVASSGGTAKRIGSGFEARWSPDGRRLVSIGAFQSGALIATSWDGRVHRQITLDGIGPDPIGPALPQWFPGGREIYFFSVGGWFRVTPTAHRRARAQRIAKRGGALSPDGRRVAFARMEGSTDADRRLVFYTAALNGTARRVIARVPAAAGTEPERIDWSADGRRLVFDGGGIGVVNLDGTGYRRLQTGWVGGSAPAWSPDGTRIVFVRFTGALTEASRANEIATMNADGSEVRVVATDPRGVSWPDWQPIRKRP